MKSTTNPHFRALYQFNRDKPKVKATMLGNILLIVVFLFGRMYAPTISAHAWFCLSSAVGVGIINTIYDWKNPLINLWVIGTYLALFIVEVTTIGIPESPMPPTMDFSKGVLLDLFMYMVPYFYVGLRLGFIIPLIQVFDLSRKLPKEGISTKR